MPAKTKYLSGSWKRFSKVMAAIFGGYIATMALHLGIAKVVVDDTVVLFTSTFTTFMFWVFLMIMTFFIHQAWKVWLLFAGITGIGLLIIFTF